MAVTSSNISGGAHRILIVDDNTNGLLARRSVLEEIGYEVVTKSSPQDALLLFDQQRFDLVITDYRMPDMDGVDFIASLRKLLPGLPVILISGFVDALGLKEENTGADIVLQKSASEVQLLVRAVNRLLRRKTPRKPPGDVPPAAEAKRKGNGR